MSEAISIDISTKGVDEAIQLLRNIRGGTKKAIVRALNRTAEGIKKDGSAEASRAFIVSKEIVKKHMRVSAATSVNPSVIVSRKGPRFLAKRFPRNANTNPGVSGGKAVFLRPRRDGSGWSLDAEKNLSKAFVVRDKKGKMVRGPGIYRRIGNNRNHITHARGLSVPDMLGAPDVHSVIQQKAAIRLRQELDNEVKKLLKSEGAQS